MDLAFSAHAGLSWCPHEAFVVFTASLWWCYLLPYYFSGTECRIEVTFRPQQPLIYHRLRESLLQMLTLQHEAI